MFKKTRFLPFVLTCSAVVHHCSAATLQEDFAANPASRGWNVFGNTNLFHWNATNQNLEVTWDSSQPNSYFHHPLGTILAKDDDFSLAFELRLSDVAVGTTTNKPFTFELAVNLLRFGEATATNYLRGTGTNSPDLFEFDYFPDSGFGATVAPTIISSSNEFNDGGFTFPLELTTNDLFAITMTYTASNQTLHTEITRNGSPFGPVNDATLSTNFSDFGVDTVAISSYNDAGQDPQFGGSIFARGTVDNFLVTLPPLPVTALTGSFSNTVWQAQFVSRSNWLYTLERTTNFVSWTAASTTQSGTGTNMVLQDASAPAQKAFYRVRAERP